MANSYNNDSIKALEIVEAIRLKPASIGISDHNHTFIELLANSIDEFREGFGNIIKIIKFKNGAISIQDFGRGVPMDKNSQGEYAYDLCMNRLWAGGKYDNNDDESNYQYSLGTNGVGMTGVNYTSDFFVVLSTRDGYEYTVKFQKGILAENLIKKKSDVNYTGTFIYYRPSKEVFNDNEVSLSFIQETLKQQSIVNKGLKFELFDEESNKHFNYYYENGILDYINEISNGKNITDIKTFTTEGRGRESVDSNEYKVKMEIYMCFNNTVNHTQYFHNSSWLQNGGTPESASINALTSSIDKYIKDNNKYVKNEKKITSNDVLDSLILITNTYSTISLYDDQTKKSIKSKFMQIFMSNFIKEQMEITFIEDKEFAEKVTNQVLINKRAREKSESIRTDIKKKLEGDAKGKFIKIDGLKDCSKLTFVEDREIWLCEGISACSTLTDARNPETMATYPLKGRFINSLKSSVNDVLNNKPALGIIQALNCGIEIPVNEKKHYKDMKTFNINNLRYGNIILACDADSFGHGINLSLIAFFYKFMPQLLREGRIYISISPRYEIRYKDDLYFAYDEANKEEIIKKLNGKKFTIGIVKGLGELNKDVFWEYVMNPKKRKLKQIYFSDISEEKIKYYMEMLMGEDIDNRKKYVQENITHANLIELD